MAKKVVKNSPKNIKQMTAIGVMVVVAAILVSAFYVSAKLITMEVPTAPSQSEAAGKNCPKGKNCSEPTPTRVPPECDGRECEPYKANKDANINSKITRPQATPTQAKQTPKTGKKLGK